MRESQMRHMEGPMFRLRTLGGALIEGPSGALTGAVSQRRRLALLALLAASRAGISRDRIVALLWPESDDERARHALAQLLYTLRRDLGADVITGSATSLRLDANLIASDVDEFNHAMAEQEYERASDLYTGPFLDGFHVGGCREFERWVDDERARLVLAARRALEALAAKSGEDGRHAEAVRWWRKLAGMDPYDARVAVGLMNALAASGDRAGAIRHARTWQALTSDEFGAEPDPTIAELAAALERASDAVPSANATTPREPVLVRTRRHEGVEGESHGPGGPPATPPGTGIARPQKPGDTPRRISFAAVVAVVLTLVLYAARGRDSSAARARIVIADVENATGEPIFDRTVPLALGVSLGQSNMLVVVSPERVQETLARMRRPGALMDESTAREVAIREGARFSLVPGVRRIEAGYEIGARLLDPHDGGVVALEVEHAATQGDVIEALDRLGRRVRRSAGESARSITSRSFALPRLTTASLAALEKFANGSSAFSNGQWSEAQALWQDAVRIDTAFSTAYAALGVHAYFMNRAADGEHWFGRAAATIGGLPPREQTLVRARMESWRGNRDSSVVLLRTYLVEEPDDLEALAMLGYDYLRLGRDREGMEVFRRLVHHDSLDVSALINLATVEKGLSEYDSAIAHYRRAFRIAPDVETENSNINLEWGGTWVQAGHADSAEAVFHKMLLLGRDQRARGLRSIAMLAMYRGKYADAAGPLEEAIRLNRVSQAGTSEVRNRLLLATTYVQRGLREQARIELDSAHAAVRRFDADPILMYWLGKALVRFGALAAARDVHALLESRRHPSNVSALASSEALRGEILIEQDAAGDALSHLQTALNRDSTAHTLESLAYGYARAGEYPRALVLYEELSQSAVFGAEAQEPWRMAPFYIARVAEQIGDVARASRAYQQFLDSWPQADAQLPVLADARNRLAVLRSGHANQSDRR